MEELLASVASLASSMLLLRHGEAEHLLDAFCCNRVVESFVIFVDAHCVRIAHRVHRLEHWVEELHASDLAEECVLFCERSRMVAAINRDLKPHVADLAVGFLIKFQVLLEEAGYRGGHLRGAVNEFLKEDLLKLYEVRLC